MLLCSIISVVLVDVAVIVVVVAIVVLTDSVDPSC